MCRVIDQIGISNDDVFSVDVSFLEYELKSSRPAFCMTTVVDLWAAIHQSRQFVQRIGTNGGVSAAIFIEFRKLSCQTLWDEP
jgi:hypothetical protein